MKFSTYISIIAFLATVGSPVATASSADAIVNDGHFARRHHHANLAQEIERAEARRALQARVVGSKVVPNVEIRTTPTDAVDTSKRFFGLDDGSSTQHNKKRSGKGKKKCTAKQKLRKAAAKHHAKHGGKEHHKHKHHKHKANSATHQSSTPTQTHAAKASPVTQDDADELVDCDEHGNPVASASTTPAAEAVLAGASKKVSNDVGTGNDNDDDSDNNNSSSSSGSKKSSSTSSASKSGGTQSSSSSGSVYGGSGKGLFGLSFGGQCSSADADDEHPNGSSDFLTCGISKSDPSSVWHPPNVKLSQLKVISADQAAQSSVFSACSPYKSHFESAEKSTGVPAVLLMSFALQESSCQPDEMGPNGEFGMMQITKDKCGGAPDGNCRDVDFNIRTGAKYLIDTINNQCGGNALCGIGQYNGWQAGKMTYSSATNTQWGCYAQNNLDYLSSLLNGWAQGKDGNDKTYIKFNNLARCS